MRSVFYTDKMGPYTFVWLRSCLFSLEIGTCRLLSHVTEKPKQYIS